METYILSSARTPIGSFLGALSSIPAPRLGALAIESALNKSGVSKEKVDAVYMGNVIQAGVGQAPARQAALFAGISDKAACLTVNKVCGSGMAGVILGSQAIQCGDAELVVAGGMENMSLAPHLVPQSRTGIKFGESKLLDSMEWDGLRDVYTERAMGGCAEECATKYGFSREAQDQFAIESFKRAQKATQEGLFKDEIAAVTVKGKKGDTIISEDEGPARADFAKMPKLRPAFSNNGTITAANASSINDGAAALVLGGARYKDKAQFRIVSYAVHAGHPTWFTTAPVGAMKKSLERAKMDIKQIDLFEINEAFALVTMAAMKDLELDPSRVNIYGGAVALGHPIGCSGARILTTLMSALKNESKKYGMASICIGGGEALSMIIERL